jgi:hypothetical protein
MNTGTSIYIVEKCKRLTDYRELVGVYENRELADQGGEESLELNEPADWNIIITILPLNGKLG